LISSLYLREISGCLSSVERFEFRLREVVEALVRPLVVEPGDVLVYCVPASLWCTSSTSAPRFRVASAIRSAPSQVSAQVGGELPADHAAREGVDDNAKNTTPSQ
jgi:hypothetical protein